MEPYYGKSTRKLEPEPPPPKVYTLECLYDDPPIVIDAQPVTTLPVMTFAPGYASGLKALSPAWDPERKDKCREAIRSHNRVPLRPSTDQSGACNSRNPRHLQAAWIRCLRDYEPFAQYIVTIRSNGSVPTQRMLKVAGHLDIRLNQIVLGPRWHDKCNHRRQIAPFGVTEGDYSSHNSHMHLVLFSRTQIFDEDIHELCFQLYRKKYVREFWYEQADPTKLGGYLKYILKGFHGPHGIKVTDLFYDSKSLPRIR